MKNIILDHFRRWWWVLMASFIAYFVFQAFYIHKDNSQSSNDPTLASIQQTFMPTTIPDIFMDRI
jgi:hypothetical protein